jgi:hypothetical protein
VPILAAGVDIALSPKQDVLEVFLRLT